jgi:isoquinoline 1-oxidoreductase
MSEKLTPEDTLAPERYELDAEPAYRFDLTRRQVLKFFGGGVAVVLTLGDPATLQAAARQRRSGASMPSEIGAWLHVDGEGAITVYTGKAEVGQNIRTSLAQIVAEELRVPVESLDMIMGDTDRTPYDRGTFGSRTTPVMGAQLRKVAAATRELLLDLAAEAWKAERGSLIMADGKVTNTSTDQSMGIGRIAGGRKLVRTITDDEPVTSARQWRVAGKSVPKARGRSFVTGQHKYAADMVLPDMLYGKILRPPAFGATLISVDTEKGKNMAGVTVVHDGEFIGVTAPDEQTASRAIAAIRAEWKITPQPSKPELFDYLKENPDETQGWGGSSKHLVGSVEEGLAVADGRLKETYTVDYIAHAPLEPRAAVAHWTGGKLTVWTGTQRPFGVRSELAQVFRIPEDRVRVIMPDTGSGYGGKHTGEAAIEAARLAKAARKPVRLAWTREEEFTWAYFRPAGVIEINSGVRSDGSIIAWEFHNYNSGTSAIRTMYEVPNQHIEFHPARSPLRQGSYRSLAAAANHFARESHMDELARMLKMDPLEFRTKNLVDPRLRAVFEAAAKSFGWGERKRSPGQGFGIAGGFDKGGYVATCAEVAVDRPSGRVKVVRVAEAFECGSIINPEHLKNQVEGAIIQGLGGALFESIEFENGRILNPSFSGYRVPRFNDMPSIEVVLLDRKDLPSAGGGETPIVGIAPAVGNAIFDATGVRLRGLQLAPRGVQSAPNDAQA